MKPAPGRAHVVAILQIPPPVTGLSAVNLRMLEELRMAGLLLAEHDVAPQVGTQGLGKQIGRAWRTVGAISTLVRARSLGGTTLYMPCDGGIGLLLNFLTLLAARAMGYQVWLHHHSFAYVNRRSTLMAMLIRYSPRGMTHIALCHEMLDGLRARYTVEWNRRANNGEVLPNAFMIDAGDGPAQRNELLTLGHLSNLTTEKGAVRFVEIFSSLRKEGLSVRARIAGPICDEETAAAIREAETAYPGDFFWLGPLYGTEKVTFLESIDAFIFPSDYLNEAQPLVLLEALAHGAAILSTQRGCMGCDHAKSPGVIAPLATYHDVAISWLKAHIEAPARTHLPSHAKARFEEMKVEAREILDRLLASM